MVRVTGGRYLGAHCAGGRGDLAAGHTTQSLAKLLVLFLQELQFRLDSTKLAAAFVFVVFVVVKVEFHVKVGVVHCKQCKHLEEKTGGKEEVSFWH